MKCVLHQLGKVYGNHCQKIQSKSYTDAGECLMHLREFQKMAFRKSENNSTRRSLLHVTCIRVVINLIRVAIHKVQI
jgi:hypothetical protein